MIRFNISARFISAFALLLAVMAAMGMFSIAKIGEVNAIATEMRGRWLPASQTLGDMHAYISQYRIKQSELVFAQTPEARTRDEKLLRNAGAVIDGLVKDYEKLLTTPEQKAAFADFKTNWQSYNQSNDRLMQMASTGNPAARYIFEGEALDGFYTVEDNVLQMIDLNGKGASAVSGRSDQIYGSAHKFMIGAAVAGLVIAVVLLAFLMISIARPINRMSEAVGRLVNGDLDVPVPCLSRSDEVGSLARALERFKDLFAADHQRAQEEQSRARETQATIDAIGNGLSALAEGNLTHRVPNGHGAFAKLHADYNEAVSQLAGVLGQIVEGCHTIKLGTDEIAAAATDLSHRSEQQANSLAETSRTLSEFTGTVKVTADNARQTSSRLSVARETAGKVDDTASRAVAAMRSIETSSREMAEIVAVIDGIAFQTNLLALNAGVEAARAGDAGKGFAVVANEVRALAQRSADAAKDIRELISTSTGQVSGGVTLVESSGEALRQIVTEVTAVSALVDEIAEAAEKQASGIADISSMVNSMDGFTQQNAAMVEESTAGTRNLSAETQALVQQLGLFQLGSAGDTRLLGPTMRNAPSRPAPARAAPAPAPAPSRKAAAPQFQGNTALKPPEDDWSEF
jgi:methyl-accepting chemotaxis protein